MFALTEVLGLRGRQLADPLARHELAISLRLIVAHAERPHAGLSCMHVEPEAVLSWREGLLGLAERLERPGTVNPCGVARALALLIDPGGPLYSSARERSLGEMVWWVADGLRVCPPHRWGCPVVMELDPDHVAWTCGLCGVIATTDDPAVRPA
jgi:hypothetical protein